MSKKAILTMGMTIILGGCAMMGEVEAEIVKRQAVEDARALSKDVQLGYLTCFAFWDDHKQGQCQNILKQHTSNNRQNARNWEYILEHDREAERLGFVAFLKDEEKTCTGIDETPQHNREINAYVVNCTDGNSYKMAFNHGEGIWSIKQ